jgi:FKBP-type peptidyl-prolyl cis-trans isomerase 2
MLMTGVVCTVVATVTRAAVVTVKHLLCGTTIQYNVALVSFVDDDVESAAWWQPSHA